MELKLDRYLQVEKDAEETLLKYYRLYLEYFEPVIQKTIQERGLFVGSDLIKSLPQSVLDELKMCFKVCQIHVYRVKTKRDSSKMKRAKLKQSELECLLFAQQDRCKYCQHYVQTFDRCIDHIVPLSLFGYDGLQNLQILCGLCHKMKTICEGICKSLLYALTKNKEISDWESKDSKKKDVAKTTTSPYFLTMPASSWGPQWEPLLNGSKSDAWEQKMTLILKRMRNRKEK
jgi:hypothetical protein